MPAATARALTTPATVNDCEEAVAIVLGAFGVGPGPDADPIERQRYAERIHELAEILATAPWTRGEFIAAAHQLTFSVKLRDEIRFGRTLTPADFREVIEGDKPHESIKRHRLYTYHEAMDRWQRMGNPGIFSAPNGRDDSRAVFEPVWVEGREKPLWRMR